MLFLKGLLYSTVGFVVLIAITIAYITQVLDPNDLKPALVDAAKDKGITLKIDGEMSWSFYPWLGIKVDLVSVQSPVSSFRAKRIEGNFSFFSFLSDTVVIDSLIAIDPQLTFVKTKPIAESALKSNGLSKIKPTIIIRALSITNGEIRGLAPGLKLDRVNMKIDHLAPVRASDFELKALVHYQDILLPVHVRSKITPTASFDGLTARDLSIQSRQVKLTFDGYLSATKMGSFGGEGQLKISPFSPRTWLAAANLPVPVTRDLSKLTTLTLDSSIKLSDEMLSLQDLKIRLDAIDFDGKVGISLEPLNVNLNGAITSIDFDRYRSVKQTQNDSKEESIFSILPGSYKLDVQSLTTNEIEFRDLSMEIGVSEDEVTLGRLDLKAFGGSIQSSGAHLRAPQITLLNGTIEGVKLNEVPLDDSTTFLEGQLKGAFDLKVAGQTADEVQQSLSGSMRLSLTDVSLEAIDVSDALCQLLGQSKKIQNNEEGDTAQLSIEFQEGIGTIETIDATVANMRLAGNGRISLLSKATALSGELKIPSNGDFGSCQVFKEVRGLVLPFNCRGNLKQTKFDCGFNKSALQSIAKQKTHHKLKQ